MDKVVSNYIPNIHHCRLGLLVNNYFSTITVMHNYKSIPTLRDR